MYAEEIEIERKYDSISYLRRRKKEFSFSVCFPVTDEGRRETYKYRNKSEEVGRKGRAGTIALSARQ
jgi:hypothetical protein